MAVWDLEKGMAFYRDLLGATFSQSDGTEAAKFGVQVAMAFDAGIELVAPLPDVDSHIRTWLTENGEGITGVVFAVPDADAARDAAAAHGCPTYYSLDYDQIQIDKDLAGYFTQYKEHFITAAEPLSGTVLLGEFVEKAG